MEFLNATFSADTQGLTGAFTSGDKSTTLVFVEHLGSPVVHGLAELEWTRIRRISGLGPWGEQLPLLTTTGYLLLLNFVTTTSFSSVRFYFDSGSRGVSRPRTEDTPQAYSLRGFPS
ncbi:hypothetical protein PC128_g18076 [Phytophthora cactorum]|nr:hypothetical protein PC128_g18076 [Phytophthora cactorum]